jgi:hypothetical protein
LHKLTPLLLIHCIKKKKQKKKTKEQHHHRGLVRPKVRPPGPHKPDLIYFILFIFLIYFAFLQKITECAAALAAPLPAQADLSLYSAVDM